MYTVSIVDSVYALHLVLVPNVPLSALLRSRKKQKAEETEGRLIIKSNVRSAPALITNKFLLNRSTVNKYTTEPFTTDWK